MGMDTIIYLIITLFVFLGLLWFVNSYKHGSAYYEDFYSKEIANIINNAEPGMEFKIDITPLASIAIENGKPVGDIVYIDNVNNLVVVSSRLNTGTVFNFFNDVDAVDFYVESPSGSPEATRFIFKILEKQKDDVRL